MDIIGSSPPPSERSHRSDTVLAALIAVHWGQPSLAWFAVFSLVAMLLLTWIGSKQRQISAEFAALRAARRNCDGHPHYRDMLDAS